MNNIKKLLRKTLLKEGYISLEEDVIDEMAYPASFNPEEFENIKSFAGKQKYVKERLLGKMGSGSARAVFKIDDEKVLKVALNNKGIAQNSAEAEGYKQNYPIVAHVFDSDIDDMWLEMELARKVTPKRFKELTGIDSKYELDDFLRMGVSQKPIYGELSKEKFQYIIDDEDGWGRELINFISDYEYPIPGDFNRLSSYGEVLRNGKPMIVLVDFGATEDVLSSYYSKRR
jgi:hypothetical protein